LILEDKVLEGTNTATYFLLPKSLLHEIYAVSTMNYGKFKL